MAGVFRVNPERDRSLCERYSKIFVDRDMPESVCPMGRGLAISYGWYHLIGALSAPPQREACWNGAPQVTATQVKEELGGLRFNVKKASEHQWAMIDAAVALSMHTCERCGSPGRLGHLIHGGIATRCERHGADGFVNDPIAHAAWTSRDQPSSARRGRPARRACSITG